MIKVLGINGSPRIGGNTDILIDKALEGAKNRGASIEKVILNELEILPCQECDIMNDDGTCHVRDNMTGLYEKIKSCDVLILASPIFFGSLSAQTKTMIDRFQCLWRAKYILGKDIRFTRKKGYFVSVEGSDREDFFINARSIVKNLFATISASYDGELFCPKVDRKAGILEHGDYLEKAFNLGIDAAS
ncbi:MAG: flavodoxin family protein [Candidatus Omnitrophota bacterium]